MQTADKEAVLVVGCHRSGTSMITHLVHELGWSLGRELLGEHACNQDGLWENSRIVQLNEQILQEAGSAWHDTSRLQVHKASPTQQQGWIKQIVQVISEQFDDARICIKDPRICRLLPLYIAALGQGGYQTRILLMARSPQAVAESLYRRDGMPCIAGEQLWLSHMVEALQAIKHLAPEQILYLTYEVMLADRQAPVVRLKEWLGQPAETAVTHLIRQDLNHAGLLPSAHSQVQSPAQQLFQLLQLACSRLESPLEQENINRLTAQLESQLPAQNWLRQPLVCVGYLAAGEHPPLNQFDLFIQDGEQPESDAEQHRQMQPAGVFYNLGTRGEQDSLARAIGLARGRDLLLIFSAGTITPAELGQLKKQAQSAAQAMCVSVQQKVRALFLPRQQVDHIDPWQYIGQGDALDQMVAAEINRLDKKEVLACQE